MFVGCLFVVVVLGSRRDGDVEMLVEIWINKSQMRINSLDVNFPSLDWVDFVLTKSKRRGGGGVLFVRAVFNFICLLFSCRQSVIWFILHLFIWKYPTKMRFKLSNC